MLAFKCNTSYMIPYIIVEIKRGITIFVDHVKKHVSIVIFCLF